MMVTLLFLYKKFVVYSIFFMCDILDNNINNNVKSSIQIFNMFYIIKKHFLMIIRKYCVLK